MVTKKTGNVDYAVNTTEDIYILHNTKETDISSADYWPEIGHNTINCPRCKKILEHAQNLLKKGPTISGNDVTGICDHCKMKDQPCFKCRQVVKRFVPGTSDRTDIKKERVKHWLTEIGYLLQGINKRTGKTKRAHSDIHIDQICHDRQRSARTPDVEQLFQHLELDLAGISEPHIDNQINEKYKDKKLVAHFPQLDKLETSIVLKDSFKENVPSTSALYKDDVSLGQRSNGGRILKPEKILTKYITSPVRTNSSETVSIEESVDSFEQIFKETISGTGSLQSDEIIGFKPNETKQSPNIIISGKYEEIPTKRKRARSVKPHEIMKENKRNTKTKESERTELSKKYHSAENLLIKAHGTHGIREHNLKQANRIIFPRQQSNKQTKQKSSSELIKDTKDKLTRAVEEKKLKKLFYEHSHEKTIDHQEYDVDDMQNVRQEAKYSVTSDKKDELRPEEEVYQTRKDSQKSTEDIDINEAKTQTSEKDTQTGFEKGGYKSEEGAQQVNKDAKNVAKVGYKSEKDIQKAPIDAQKSERDGYKPEKGAQKSTSAEKDDNISEKGTKKTTKNAPPATKYGYISEKDAQKALEDAPTAVKGGYKSMKGTQKTSGVAHEAEKDGYTFEKDYKKSTKDAKIAEKDGYKFEKGTKKYTKDAQAAEIDGYTTEKGAKKSTKTTQSAEKNGSFEKGSKKSTKDAQIAEKDGYKFEKGTKKYTKDAQAAEIDGYTTEKRAKKSTKTTQTAEKDGSFEKGSKKSTKDAQIAEKDGYKFEKGTKKYSKDAQAAEIDGYTTEKGAKKSTKTTQTAEKDGSFEKGYKQSTKDAQIAEKDGYKFENGTKNTTKDAQKEVPENENDTQMTPRDAQKSERGGYTSKKKETHAQKAELRGQTNTKIIKSKGDAQNEMTPKSLKSAQKLQKEDKITEKITEQPADLEFDKQIALKIKQKSEALEKKTMKEIPSSELKNSKDHKVKLKDQNEKDVPDIKKKDMINTKNIAMEAADRGFEKHVTLKINQETKKLQKRTKTELPSIEAKRNKDLELELKAEREKADVFKNKLQTSVSLDDIKRDRRLGAQPIDHDLINIKSIKIRKSEGDDLILKLVEVKKATGDSARIREIEPIKDMRLPDKKSKFLEHHRIMVNPPQSDLTTKTSLLWTTDSEIYEIEEHQIPEVIIGSKIRKIRPQLNEDSEVILPLHQVKPGYDSSRTDKKQEIAQTPKKSKTQDSIKQPVNENQEDVPNKKKKDSSSSTKINIKNIAMEAADRGFEKHVILKINQETKKLQKRTKTELPSIEVKRNKDLELELKAEREKADVFKNKLQTSVSLDDIKRDRRLGAQPIDHDLLNIKSIKIRKSEGDDLILKLVDVKKSTGDSARIREIKPIKDMILPDKKSKFPKHHRIMVNPPQSDLTTKTSLLQTTDSEIDETKEHQITDIIIGPQIFKIRPKFNQDSEVILPLHQVKTGYDSSRTDKKQEIAQTPETSTTQESIKQPVNENQETVLRKETPRTMEAVEPRPMAAGTVAASATSKGYVRYTLSDRTFIDNGWTLLPTEKVVRKMNVYRMRPARPEFDWFEHNKNKRLMEYDTGEKLAEFDDNGRGRWFYRNGRMALDYYDAEELNAGQRFVIYSNGEPDERGRSRPYTLLATFDFAGNGIVFDHRGKIRLKYNQTEGVVLDRSIGPVSHWKWHTLNDPPVLQQVMIDTQIAHKDPKIMKMGGPNENKPRKDNDEMLAIEFDNFIKEKSKKLSQTFKPFQIKMKALKINEHFSLRVLDQATVYLFYRDGTTNLKLNIGMVLDQKEIVDTDTAEVGEVSSSMEKLPARTASLASMQKSVAHAQHYDWKRTERDRKLRPTAPNASVDKLVAGISRPARLPPRPHDAVTQSTSLTTTAAEHCKCSRKPTSTCVYYDTRFY